MGPIDYAKEYPELSETGKKTTQAIIDRFSGNLKEMLNETLVSFTHNLAEEITSDDSWIDLRLKVIQALCGYHDREEKQDGTYLGQWWVKIRAKILEENREAIINDIIADKEAEISRLKKQLEYCKSNR